MSKKVLLIGWDAADWRVINPLMDAGKMPALKRLVERGVVANLATLRPILSPMLWTSIATGKRPYKHGILGFTEPTPDGSGVRPVSSLSRTTKALWNILHQRGFTSNVIGWWPSNPVEPIRGAMVSNLYQQAVGHLDKPWPIPGGTVHPARLGETLAGLRLHPEEITPESLMGFVPRAAEVDQKTDRRLNSVLKILAECTSVHAATTYLMEHEPWDVTAVYYDAIDHFSHGFMSYHPPRRPHVPEPDFELYQGVVEAGYRYHDMMLARLLALAPDDVTVIVCSDHGFHPDHNRPEWIPNEPAGPAVEHRDFGMLLIAGPGIRRDERIHGANLLDITPTILALLGLPVGDDMDGKPLLQAFETPPVIETIPSWDAVDGDAAMFPSEATLDPIAAKAALDQLIALGYVEPLEEDRAAAVAKTSRELSYNLARAYMDAQQHLKAVPILEELYRDYPLEHRFAMQTAQCYRALGWQRSLRILTEKMHARRVAEADEARGALDAMKQTVETRKTEAQTRGQTVEDAWSLLDEKERKEWLRLRSAAEIRPYDSAFLRGYVEAADGNHTAAVAYLREAEQANPRRPGLHLSIGEAYLRLKQPDDAEYAFRRALKIDPENPYALCGLARCLIQRRRPHPALEAAIEAVGLLYDYPVGHFVLGQALARLGRYTDAARAMEVAVSINPNFRRAHQRLAQIYRRRLFRPDDADAHQRIAREIAHAERRRPSDTGDRLVEEASEAVARHDAPERFHLEMLSEPSDDEGPFVTVVAGLPRTGTSMMMQMLAAGGQPVLADGRRAADADNPRGYFELEAATRLHQESGWIADTEGKAVKIVAQLLGHLPKGHRYRVILMQRDLDEVLESQRKMLEHLGRKISSGSPERLRHVFAQQLRRVKAMLARREDVQALVVDYREVTHDPHGTARAVAHFLGGGLDIDTMAQAVDANLYRNRRSATPESSR